MVLGGRSQQRRGADGHERVGIDLSVRVVQGDADLLAAVLEGEHVLDGLERGQLAGAVGPDVHDSPGPFRRQRREAGAMVAGEADDLAAAQRRSLGQQGAPREPGSSGSGSTGSGSRGSGSTGSGSRGSGSGGSGGKGREAVLEDDHVVLVGGDL